jgi:hypothetical protein
MVYKWAPGTQYQNGAVVSYGGHLYKIIQPHQSLNGWEPPNTPALWGRLPEEEHDDYNSGRRDHCVEDHHRRHSRTPSPHRPQPGGWGHDEHRDDRREPSPPRPDQHQYQNQNQSQNQNQNQNQNQQQQNQNKPDDDGKKPWLTETQKHGLEIGGGVLGALAIGAGIYAYSEHKSKASEEAKQKAWREEGNSENWEAGAIRRTEHYNRGGQAPPVRWVLMSSGQPFPRDAIVGGHENNQKLYIIRAFHEGGLHIGKAAGHINDGGCSFAWGGQEIGHVTKFEVLVGDENAVRWIHHAENDGPVKVEGWQPVEGGKETDGRFIFVSQVRYQGGVHPCKYTVGEREANFGWGGEEHKSRDFNVLAYA